MTRHDLWVQYHLYPKGLFPALASTSNRVSFELRLPYVHIWTFLELDNLHLNLWKISLKISRDFPRVTLSPVTYKQPTSPLANMLHTSHLLSIRLLQLIHLSKNNNEHSLPSPTFTIICSLIISRSCKIFLQVQEQP